jgi:protein-tyrosine phosphatase
MRRAPPVGLLISWRFDATVDTRMHNPRTGILFVCLGNVCRSPMAECVANQMLKGTGLESHISVSSRGTAAFNAGKPMDPRAVHALRAHGYDPEPHAAAQISDNDFCEFGQIIAMDRSNLHTLTAWRPPGFAGQLRLLPATSGTGGIEVPDPFYGEASQFGRALALIENGVSALLRELLAPPV